MPLPLTLDKSLKQSINASLKAYADGSARFFEYLSKDVRVYTLDSQEPIKGREEFSAYFAPTLIKSKRIVKPLHQDVQVFENQAILSQVLQVSSGGVGLPVKQTIVWTKNGAKWEITHMHNGRAGEPMVLGAAPKTLDEVRVLNERIATVAAVVGVAQ
jgi:hypothetical protein